MRARIRARLERLECRVAATDQGIKPWLGHLKRLLREYQGERHAIVARELPKQGDQEWVGFEEVPGPIRTRRSSWPAGYHSASMSCSWGLIPEQKKTSKLWGTSRRRRRSSGNPGMCRALVRAHHRLHGTLGAANPRFIRREVFANGSVKTSAE